jgi:spore maturation protein A
MLNYIWAGLIISSLLFAIGYDVADLRNDRYRNGEPLPVTLVFPGGYAAAAHQVPVQIRIDPRRYAAFYHTTQQPAPGYDGYLVQTRAGVQLRFAAADSVSLPQPLATIAGVSKSQKNELQGRLTGFAPPAPAASGGPAAGGAAQAPAAALPPNGPPPAAAVASASAGVVFERVQFVKMNAIAGAALSFAGTAATIALGLIGVLALFLGLLKIGEKAGLVESVVKMVQPVLRPIFPEVPRGHPALGLIAMNITANMFGLGNAATPFGIKAMEELQKLNPSEDTATNSQVMLLAINTASVQLVPPVLLLAIMGLQINMLILPIIASGACGLIIAIAAAKLYGRLPSARASDPNRKPPAPPSDAPAAAEA